MHQLNEFQSKAELDNQFADVVTANLSQAIAKNGKASIAFSGGSTPKGFFQALSNADLDWSKVIVTLADDRWVDVDHNDSNTKLIRENLLVNKAKDASLFVLKQGDELNDNSLESLNEQAQQVLPLDVVILGMGEDGHTASLFPCSQQISVGLNDTAQPALMKVVPTTAPYERITFNFSALINTASLYLHIVGDNKKQVLEQALASDNALEMPIRAFLSHPQKTCEIYWTK